jgi:hypothetical protein
MLLKLPASSGKIQGKGLRNDSFDLKSKIQVFVCLRNDSFGAGGQKNCTRF